MDGEFFGYEIARRWEYEIGFHLTSDPTRLAKIIAHHELYKSIVGLPGDVVEGGVYKGASLIRFATFRAMHEGPGARRIVGFDAFGAFPPAADPADRAFVERFERAGGDGIGREELLAVLAAKGLDEVELVAGDVRETVPRYVRERPELRIALLHVDVDVHEPTRVLLEHLFDRVVRGGLVLFDDYGSAPGETRAIDDFLGERRLTVEKLPFAHAPSFVRIG